MNWGKWIIVSFIVFAIFIATLVTICIRQDVGLVSASYYKDELVYQQQMKRIQNVSALENPPVLRIIGDKLVLEFADMDRIEAGQLKLFRPSNSMMDKNFDVKASTITHTYFNLDQLKKGMYRAKFQWTMDGKEYYHEEVILI